MNVKQGIVDLALLLILGSVFYLRNRINWRQLPSPYFLGGVILFLVVWFELLVLLPFEKWKVPWINTDPNVRIRKEYWTAAIKQFSKGLGFGIGPDNYGNYYQQTRTVSSVRLEEAIISNDAHSSLFQTLATLGFFGLLAFVLLWILLAYSLYLNIKNYPQSRKLFYFLALYFFIYTSNSLVSPITLPNKFIFWSLVGLNFGLAGKNFSLKLRERLKINTEPIQINIGKIMVEDTPANANHLPVKRTMRQF